MRQAYQSKAVCFYFRYTVAAAVVWVARPWQLGMEVTQTEVK